MSAALQEAPWCILLSFGKGEAVWGSLSVNRKEWTVSGLVWHKDVQMDMALPVFWYSDDLQGRALQFLERNPTNSENKTFWPTFTSTNLVLP